MKTKFLAMLIVCFFIPEITQAELIIQWDFNDGLGTDRAATSPAINANFVGSTANPTYLATGGRTGSGALSFDGVNDYMTPSSSYSLGNADWTVSFWIKTSDTADYSGYGGTPEVSVLGNMGGDVGFALGIEGGKATFTHFYSGWHIVQGTTAVANNQWHALTFVHHFNQTIDIYVDGLIEVSGAASYDGQYSYVIPHIGASYGPKYANMTLDELSIYNHALTSSEISQFVTGVPEMNTMLLLALGFVFSFLRRK